MPIKKSAFKALRQSKKRHVINTAKKSKIHQITKQIKKAIAANKKAEALKLIQEAYQTFDKAAKRGTIHKKTASRKKSRLMKKIGKLK